MCYDKIGLYSTKDGNDEGGEKEPAMMNALSLVLFVSLGSSAEDLPFVQEYHEAFSLGTESGMNDVRAVAVDGAGNVWAATGAGLGVLKPSEQTWTWPLSEENRGPAFALAADPDGTVWAGLWNGVYHSIAPTAIGVERIPDIYAPIGALWMGRQGLLAAGPEGVWLRADQKWRVAPQSCAHSIRAIIDDPRGGFWVATAMGLCYQDEKSTVCYQDEASILSCDARDLAYDGAGTLWAGGLGGITRYTDSKRSGEITPEMGLPSVTVQCLAAAPDGRMWAGTDHGLARYDGKSWTVRHGRRWLANDDVRDIAFGPDGTVWIATAGGVSAIRQRTMTLAGKADYFLDVCMKRHVRAPWIVEKCRLPVPGNITKWEPQDDDNDGGYTAFYMAGECCRYAVTKDPGALENAKRAFETLLFLEEVTGVPGFLARTVVPVFWKQMSDANRTYTDRERAEERVRDPRFKPVEERWHLSADGEWFWKGDTSSDEITAHFFGYLFYYDLINDEAERGRVRELTRRIMDYIIAHGYVLVDLDGTHTRWGVWAPERLNHDPDWRAERGVNSVEILSFLKSAYHMTSDPKYQQEYLRLLSEEGYLANIREGKTFMPGWRTHIDDELLAFAYPALLRYEDDPEIAEVLRASLDHWYTGMGVEQSAFANFIYGWLTGMDPHLDDSLFMLRDTPLDLVNWRMDNSAREDLRVVRKPLLDALQTSRLLPPSERGVIRWDKNPWEAVQGDDGHTEWAPSFWLMPYWLGRYCGFIQAPQ